MKIIETELDGVLILEPGVFGDERGYFMETYQQARYNDAGIKVSFVQDNLSFSRKNTLRGLHFQHPQGQAKLATVLSGKVYDVVLDIRRGSATFGKWVGAELSSDNKKQMFVPPGFAHGFCVLSETALFHYKCSAYYAPECEGGVAWNDPDLGIDWKVREPILSEKDAKFLRLRDIPVDKLPSSI
jgi:dTDP-4-dehydrorhamnose 3,5-epimerase